MIRIIRSNRLTMAFVLALCIALLLPAMALAAGTGDDPRPTKDVLTPADAAAKAVEDARFAAWAASRNAARAASTRLHGVRPLVIDAPYYYIWTPSHLQERPYWCAPATCQIITHYWGPLYSQSTFAQYLGTTVDGTDFSKVDDALRHFSGKSYYYYGAVDDFNTFMGHCEYGIGVKHYPIAADVKILARDWPLYLSDHAGHVIPVEAFDERYLPYRVRINDPYDESSIGGGNTFGHTTYPAYVVAGGVIAHFRQAVVR